MHRVNVAERAIFTFKNHFIAGLCTVYLQFPMQLWVKLLDQGTLTLNLLQPSHLNQRLSTQAQLNGAFDFNQTPLALSGTKVVIHKTSTLIEDHGHHMVLMAGTLDQPCSTSAATKCMSHRCNRNALQTQSYSSQSSVKYWH
eukprot:15315134-Ditylum_brightwellii.AAC.1